MSDLAIRCRGLVKRYPPDVVAVDGLDLEVRRGECFGLLGPNGAGKTTTVEILEGLLPPTAGDVEILGARWERDAAHLRARVGITLQETHLPERLTVEEVVRLFRSFYPRGRSEDEVIGLVSLEEKRRARYDRLSGGQKQRLAVACALVGEPELLFLDEPTTGLDPQSRRQLWDVVSDVKRQGRSVLLTTHYMDEAERLCDRVAIVDRGKVIALGTPRELIQRVVGHEVVEFEAPADGVSEPELRALPGVQAVRRGAAGWALTVDRLHLALPALLDRLDGRGVALSALSTHRATLEDVFVALTGRRLRD
ncbi:ABC transporter ATP-binding protein [Anaeromyxobacter oryzae]|uniref:ABC transporter ATP-binding protein n=1 Tax=Anaeromyxobacter oryzae TaxID=2918170 RepID=A0ABN6MPH5_9BACT|nr:ABC transporter ATP-binding protein [Anaeromyxobacter oryzae]BDG02200.1 ABC transporter ATP-binding protein [Anaeromyxobacter oryzae]